MNKARDLFVRDGVAARGVRGEPGQRDALHGSLLSNDRGALFARLPRSGCEDSEECEDVWHGAVLPRSSGRTSRVAAVWRACGPGRR